MNRKPHRRAKRLAALGVMAATLVGLTACSSDNDSGSAPAGSAEVATTEAPIATEPTGTAETTEAAMWSGTAPNMEPANDATAAEWQTLFESALVEATGVPGIWVALSDPTKGYWASAIGDAVVDPNRPATVADHGRIGSVTKTFTATAVLEQIDAGTMSLDDTVADLTPDLAEQFPVTADLTVEQLLSMQSGLGDYANVPGAATAQAVADPSKVWKPEELIASAIDASPVQPVGTPGYSTTNYVILGLMLEVVTGEPVDEVITDLAKRAGLDRTALLPGVQNEMPDPSSHGYIDAKGVSDLAQLAGVDVVEDTDVTEWSVSWGGAGGGMYSVIEELFAWTATAMGTTMLSADLGEQRLTLDTLIVDDGINYGLGIFELSGLKGWVGHTGQVIGWESIGLYNPETGASIAIMTNGTSGLGSIIPALEVAMGVTLG